jgi:hypothetical protein
MVKFDEAVQILRTLVPVSPQAIGVAHAKLMDSNLPHEAWSDAWPVYHLYQRLIPPLLGCYSIRMIDYTRYFAFSREIFQPLHKPWSEETKASILADSGARWINNGCDHDVLKVIATFAIQLLNLDSPLHDITTNTARLLNEPVEHKEPPVALLPPPTAPRASAEPAKPAKPAPEKK